MLYDLPYHRWSLGEFVYLFDMVYSFYLLLLPTVIIQALGLPELWSPHQLLLQCTLSLDRGAWGSCLAGIPLRSVLLEAQLSASHVSTVPFPHPRGRESTERRSCSTEPWACEMLMLRHGGVSWMSAVMSLTLKACHLWDTCWCREKGHGSGREAVQSPTWIKSLVFCQWAEWAVGGWFKDCELNFLGLGSWAASYTNYVEGVLEEERNGRLTSALPSWSMPPCHLAAQAEETKPFPHVSEGRTLGYELKSVLGITQMQI